MIEDFAIDRSTTMGCDMSGIAVGALAVCAGAIPDDIKLQPKRNDSRMAGVALLNEESEKGSVIVVEGRRDAEALSRVGFTGNPAVFHHFKGIAHFVDNHDSIGKKIILLLDMDRTGRHLTSRLVPASVE